MKNRYADVPAYVTKDGSEIRELMHPAVHGNAAQSLAEAVVAAGQATALHCHTLSEELYYVRKGRGTMTLGDVRFAIEAGDTVLIRPGGAHRVEATGDEPLKILCCCSPAYCHGDTQLL